MFVGQRLLISVLYCLQMNFYECLFFVIAQDDLDNASSPAQTYRHFVPV